MRRWLAILAVAVLAVNPAAVAACASAWSPVVPNLAADCGSACCTLACCCDVRPTTTDHPALPDVPAPSPRDCLSHAFALPSPLPIPAFADDTRCDRPGLFSGAEPSLDAPHRLARLCRWLT